MVNTAIALFGVVRVSHTAYASKTTMAMANDENCKTVLSATGRSRTVLYHIRDAWAHIWPH